MVLKESGRGGDLSVAVQTVTNGGGEFFRSVRFGEEMVGGLERGVAVGHFQAVTGAVNHLEPGFLRGQASGHMSGCHGFENPGCLPPENRHGAHALPPGEGPYARWYTVLHLRGAKFWQMNFPINYPNGRWCTLWINRKLPHLPEDRR